MKTLLGLTPRLVVAILVAGLVTGCATKRQVERIVTESNAAILARQLGADSDSVLTVSGKGKSTELDAASARIDAFIAAHPDQPDTAAALRIRQGMLLLSLREPELAKAAFSQANLTHLHTPRDRTLKSISTNLVWWFGGASSDQDGFDENDYSSATNALANLSNWQSTLSAMAQEDPEAEGIRDYVAETRAWIGLRYASALPARKADTARAAFVETVTNYVASLGTNTTQRIACGCKCEQADLPSAIPLELRRCFRSREVLKYAFEVGLVLFDPNPPQLPEPAASLVKDWN